MIIELHINNVKTHIKNLADMNVIDAISRILTYRLESARYSWQYKTGQWDGATRLLTKHLYFPTGCLDSVIGVLEGKKVSYKIIDDREFYNLVPASYEWQGYELYPYQQTIVETALDKQSGMIKVATGGGKSEIIAKMVYEFNLPTVIYVVSLDLLSQMKQTLERSLCQPIGMVGDGVCDIQKITVCSAWTAGRIYSKGKSKDPKEEDVVEDKWSPNQNQKNNIKAMIEDAQVIMLDEAQFAAASSIRAILNNSKSASYRYGLSASPWRSGGDDLLLEAAFGSNICDVKATELIAKGYLVPPKIAFRDISPPEQKIARKWAEVKKNYIVQNEQRNELLIKNVVKLLDMGRKPLVLFREHKHGRTLEEMLPDGIRYRYVSGESSKEERDNLRNDFKAGNIDLILGSSVYDQGIDLPNLDALVLTGGGKSTAKALQRIGRAIRSHPGKKDALIVDTYDQTHYVKKHSIARYQIYKTEPGFQIKMGPVMEKYVKRYKP